ncbi:MULTISPECIES: tRNA (adenosine(37)-N6)-threonylcarbamoyltransferase complex ATPase subunit type 1 TsaE [Planktothricoides]|uniref:tRNA threonylcarbamoyladenosine biosynthesis protein TsaE n=2 Tax=Planktothricoides raciborskii TaxID=132608 RepID=A0AAU8J6Z0_9CYAN|nr:MULTISPECIES: tRNA (adenosine(37)-N6)-threonylcarbamoyltransferase complex ATPase subunit type 1 TsaE [Planktothricoides]KOR38324.1 ATP-binding protein [Planktothricoides sp. SR001]MBD2543391.1 tRNA (adenosine(37)-N6)-threonylcarbamoyltransferase complex ATPase subunit type 1 TsaE [Planktothricoides raciborskii FACHB-1370]MBD2581690.1 tRNA (adenosine(37)-N6)-threonylcarbamoyltransferase complex ATPase subunit type 1 TsaE [Planktothricoides raciborskii FACHB-1261]
MRQQGKRIFLADPTATIELGMFLGRSLKPRSILLLSGDLGAGKTTLVQGIGAGLNITEPIVSPTFTLITEYLEGRIPLYHLDLYRLEPAQIPSLNPEIYWEGIEVEPGIVAIEWAERLPYLPENYWQIRLAHQPEGRWVELISIGQFDLNLEQINDLFTDYQIFDID